MKTQKELYWLNVDQVLPPPHKVRSELECEFGVSWHETNKQSSICGSKHPKVCLVADHGKGKIPKATCLLWHMRVLFEGNITGRRSGPKPPPSRKGNNGGKGNNGSNARLDKPKPEKYLDKLEAVYRAEELKARIRAKKIMSQGISYSQVAQAQVLAYIAPTLAPAQVLRVVRTALTPYEAIAIFTETIKRLRLR
jgi:hypothetical protein